MAMAEAEQDLLGKMIQTLILLPDGSEGLFFNFFEPRVLPKIALEPLIVENPPEIVFIYGGEEDWVDKSGAIKLSERFPRRIIYKNYEGLGHNIPFHPAVCKEIFAEIL